MKLLSVRIVEMRVLFYNGTDNEIRTNTNLSAIIER
jgi:hypothetical protein